jgi:chitodextrinase/type 1 fimbria pilin
MNVDDISFESTTPNESWPEVNATATDKRGDIVELANATDANRNQRSYFWEFGDGLKQQGTTLDHKYERPGRYTAKVSTRDKQGRVSRDTVTFDINATDDYSESFEHGLRTWSVNDGGFQRRGASIDGSYSAGNFEESSSKIQASDTVYPDGHQPRTFSYYYRETRDSNGGGVRVKNTNGNVEVGFATDNPQWKVYDADGSTQIYNGDGYGQWVYVEITFDWVNDEYVLYVEDQSTGTTRMYTGDLREGVDVEHVEVANYAGNWGGGSSFHMNVDDISFESTTPNESWPEINATATDKRGDVVELANATDANRNQRSYFWEFGDGLKQQGATLDHKYERPGTYTAKVSTRDEEGRVSRDTVTFDITATDDYSESFEYGLRTWSVNDGGFRQRGASIDGSVSGGNFEDSSSKIQASDTVYPDGHQPRTFSYYYRETRDSNGGGVRVTNSDGDIEVGFATDNPQWDVYDADGSTQIYNGDGYGQWVYVEITFDWENDEYVLYVEDQSTGTTQTHTGDLREGVDVERVEVANYAGDWGGGSSFHMNVDNVTFVDGE